MVTVKKPEWFSFFFCPLSLLNIVIQHVVLTEREHLAELTCSSLRAEGREGDDGEDTADESQLQRGADATLGPRQNLLQDQRIQSLQANGEFCLARHASDSTAPVQASHPIMTSLFRFFSRGLTRLQVKTSKWRYLRVSFRLLPPSSQSAAMSSVCFQPRRPGGDEPRGRSGRVPGTSH